MIERNDIFITKCKGNLASEFSILNKKCDNEFDNSFDLFFFAFFFFWQIYQVIFVSLKSAITPRPASWILERSIDGNDYYPWQYFGASDADCRSRYNLSGQNEPYHFQSDSEVICSTTFARAIPLENGEVMKIWSSKVQHPGHVWNDYGRWRCVHRMMYSLN